MPGVLLLVMLPDVQLLAAWLLPVLLLRGSSVEDDMLPATPGGLLVLPLLMPLPPLPLLPPPQGLPLPMPPFVPAGSPKGRCGFRLLPLLAPSLLLLLVLPVLVLAGPRGGLLALLFDTGRCGRCWLLGGRCPLPLFSWLRRKSPKLGCRAAQHAQHSSVNYNALVLNCNRSRHACQVGHVHQLGGPTASSRCGATYPGV